MDVAENESVSDEIDAEPTKGFFIDMLTRDIALEQAILDLVDNSVDGAKAIREESGGNFSDLWIRINFDRDRFEIVDNCGGFGRYAAKTYAFKFGRPAGATRTRHSIGQFGVGMKRALFKFGRHFIVQSATTSESWSVNVSVDIWEQEKGWHFNLLDLPPEASVSVQTPGTEIVVTEIRPEVGMRFAQPTFRNTVLNLIKSKHRQFVANGLSILVNGKHVDATNLMLLMNDELRPGVDNITYNNDGRAPVHVRLIVGLGPSAPKQAGWYVVCNGRVVLEADRSELTGWRLIEDATGKMLLPSFHNQYSRFRGLVFFDSDDSSQVPWNTTKTSVDQDNKVWQATFARMTEMMRPVIDFLNELDADTEESARPGSSLSDYVAKASVASLDQLRETAAFRAPPRDRFKGPKTVKIQYSRPIDDVEFLQEALGLSSAKAVGEATFDTVLKRQQRG